MGQFAAFFVFTMTSITPTAILREAFHLRTDSLIPITSKGSLLTMDKELWLWLIQALAYSSFQEFGSADITADMQHTTSREQCNHNSNMK